jgi:hypothetical protein
MKAKSVFFLVLGCFLGIGASLVHDFHPEARNATEAAGKALASAGQHAQEQARK